MMPNLLQYPVCLFGVLRMGGVVVNTNPLYTPTELEHQLQDSGAETIVIADNFAHPLQKALPKTPITTIIKTSVGDMLFTVREIGRASCRERVCQYVLISVVAD